MLSTTLCQQIWSLLYIFIYISIIEIHKFLSKLKKKDILSSPKTIKESEAIIENIPTKKIQGPDGFRWIIPTFQE